MKNPSEWIWSDADIEPSDEQLAQLMRVVLDDVLLRAQQAEVQFAAVMQALAAQSRH